MLRRLLKILLILLLALALIVLFGIGACFVAFYRPGGNGEEQLIALAAFALGALCLWLAVKIVRSFRTAPDEGPDPTDPKDPTDPPAP